MPVRIKSLDEAIGMVTFVRSQESVSQVYHVSTSRGNQDERSSDFSWTMTQTPGVGGCRLTIEIKLSK